MFVGHLYSRLLREFGAFTNPEFVHVLSAITLAHWTDIAHATIRWLATVLSAQTHTIDIAQLTGGPLVWTGRSPARRLGLAPCERRTRHSGLWRRVPQARAHEAVGTWWLGPGSAERRHGGHGKAARLLGFQQDITLAESAAFLWFRRHVSVLGSTRIPSTCSVTGGRSGTQHQRQFCEVGDGHVTMQHVREGTISLCQL